MLLYNLPLEGQRLIQRLTVRRVNRKQNKGQKEKEENNFSSTPKISLQYILLLEEKGTAHTFLSTIFI